MCLANRFYTNSKWYVMWATRAGVIAIFSGSPWEKRKEPLLEFASRLKKLLIQGFQVTLDNRGSFHSRAFVAQKIARSYFRA